MSSLPYLQFVSHVTKVGGLITIITNSLLIYLTHYHIQNITGVYKITIMMLAALGITFSVVEFISQPFIHFFQNSIIYFSTDNMFGLSKTPKTILLMSYACLYAIFIHLIAIQFFYRFCLITNSQSVLIFENRNIHWLISLISVSMIAWTISIYQVWPDKFSIDFIRKELRIEYGCEADETPGFFVVAFETTNYTQHFHLPSVFCAIGITTVLFIQYTIIIFCGIRIKMKMAEASLQMSDYTHRIQKQLFRTLILQILTPSVFHHIPVLVLLLTVFLDFGIRVPFGLMLCFFSFFPATDSLILMSLVTEYKKAMRKIFMLIMEILSKCHQPSRVGVDTTTKTFEDFASNRRISTNL